MNNTNNASTIAAIGVITAAAWALATSQGVDVPIYVPAIVPLVAWAVMLALRVYVHAVGAENTHVDERVTEAQGLISRATELLASEAPTVTTRKPIPPKDAS